MKEDEVQSNLKSKAIVGMLWSAIDKFAVQIGQLVISIVLANLLTPDDFGLIGMLAIFYAISQVFIDSGMEKGLVQKLDREDKDFSTVFVFNLVISLIIYALLFLFAPSIADFYDKPILVPLTRVLSLTIVINALAVVQRARLTIAVDFKTFAIVRVFAVLIAGGIGVGLAYLGYGVWALVGQMLSSAIVSVLLFYYFSRWRPSLLFDRESFSYLFRYGYKILLSGLYGQTMSNSYHMIIGKVYTASQLGFYTNARKYAEVSSASVTSIIQQVTFPILASLQDDRNRLISVYSRIVRMATFLIFPVMTMLALLAPSIIDIILVDKWQPVVPLLQWMCFVTIFYPVSVINLNILNAIGRSDLFLKVNLLKSPFTIAALVITIPMGVKAIVIGQVASSLISFFINTYYPGKLFSYGALSHIKDMAPFFIITILMAGLVALCIHFVDGSFAKIFIGGLVGVVSYLGMCDIIGLKETQEIKDLILKLVRRKG